MSKKLIDIINVDNEQNIIEDILKNKTMKKVDIRFNTNYPQKSKFEWRVLIEGVETLVNNIRREVPTWTTSTFIEGHGMKWHMSCEANEVIFDNSYILNKVAIIK